VNPRLLRPFSYRTSLQDLIRELTPRQLAPLAFAIFATFSILGPISDLLSGARQPSAIVAVNTMVAGFLALGYAFSSLRANGILIGLTILIQVLWIAFGHYVLGSLTPLPPDVVPGRMVDDAVATLLMMIASYSCFLWFINRTAARYQRVRAEMELAHQIHQVLVPAIATVVGEFEFSGLSIPSGEVGGDLVDVVSRDGAWLGYVADVSGHGVSSGVVMGMFKSALRMRLLHPGPISSLLDDLNTVLLPLKSSSMFVTAVCVRGGAGADLEYSVAGHLPILRVRASTRAVEEMTTPQVPIGMFEDYHFTSARLTCERGDLLALITDGLTEVFDAGDEQLGIEPVKEILARSSDRPLTEISGQIMAAARAHGPQLDDQTLLLMRRL
jgi:sigma-B regulation protein RsbU (phosphoserine phosphatase)